MKEQSGGKWVFPLDISIITCHFSKPVGLLVTSMTYECFPTKECGINPVVLLVMRFADD